MQDLADRLATVIGHQPTLLFSVLLVFHVFAGMTCVATGAIAALSPKRPGRHPLVGRVYFWALAIVFATSTAMSLLRWSEDAYLFVLGTLAFSFAALGMSARRQRWRGWTTAHILGMSSSYVVLLTAFYVDNGPRLPLWKELPSIAFWIGPTLIGAPIVARALSRHTHVRGDLRDLIQHTTYRARSVPMQPMSKTASQLVSEAKQRIENLTPDQLASELERGGVLLVDLREADERAQKGTIPGAVHAPRGMLEFYADPTHEDHLPEFDPDVRLILYCAGGARSALAVATLRQLGYTDVAHLEGGFTAWTAAGRHVERV